jgi:hypothetical protein
VGTLQPVFVSDNNVPDDITGSRTLTINAAWPGDSPFAWSGEFGLAPPLVFVTSVPEPSTWALFAVSLSALVIARRRRAVPSGERVSEPAIRRPIEQRQCGVLRARDD